MMKPSTTATGTGMPMITSGALAMTMSMHLVQRMAQHAVHAVEAPDAVMHGMQPPQRREAMAEVVHQHEAEVGDDEGHQDLRHIGHCVGHSPWNGNSQQITGISRTPTMFWYS